MQGTTEMPRSCPDGPHGDENSGERCELPRVQFERRAQEGQPAFNLGLGDGRIRDPSQEVARGQCISSTSFPFRRSFTPHLCFLQLDGKGGSNEH